MTIFSEALLLKAVINSMDFRPEPLTDDLANGDFTFDRSDLLNQRTHAVVSDDNFDNEFDPFARIVNHRLTENSMTTADRDSLGTGWCRKCSTSAKMSGSDPKLWSRLCCICLLTLLTLLP